ncbi:NAD(P)-dependent alcohol dehydrogenase [Lentisalinibacter orientalis]|uniref:NAD(P)-dependent alcohol dehydrogenase n=1 Tax=Lentisalinibacter orientalis TaxID=2992241 RepID=UPI00386A4D26
MRAWVYRCYGTTEVLSLERLDRPVPADDELLVRVAAAAVNPYDWHFMTGSPYFMRLMTGLSRPKEIRLGADFSGTVVAVGADVTRFSPGDEVFGGASGSFAEYLTVAEDGPVAAKPASVSFEQAAAVGIAGFTAIQALRDHGALEPGEAVLINGASGGVGTFAVQIAHAMGAEVTGVCSAGKMNLVRSIGADHVIDYRQQDYTDGERRYDVIIDLVGNRSVRANTRVLQPDGRLVIVGGPKGDWFAPLKPMIDSALMSPFVDQQVGTMLAYMTQDDAVRLGELMRDGALTPVVDRKFALDELPAAIEYWKSGKATGKVAVTMR